MKINSLTIIFISLTILVAVVALYFSPKIHVAMFTHLALLNAILNGTTTVVLVGAFIAIKNRKISLHRTLIMICLILSFLFLVSYILYHISAPTTHYGGDGILKYIYYFILISHIILAAIIVPLVLITTSRALEEKFKAHKKIARITFPIWLYVTITGVLVYIMISPYY